MSSFGISGTSAHLIWKRPQCQPPQRRRRLRRASTGGRRPRPPIERAVGDFRRDRLKALTAQAGRLMARMQATGLDPIDVGCSLASRSVFEHRAVVVSTSREQRFTGLAGLAAEPGASVAVRSTRVSGQDGGRVSWGGALIRMGRRLARRVARVCWAFDAVADELDRHLRLPLRRYLRVPMRICLTRHQFCSARIRGGGWHRSRCCRIGVCFRTSSWVTPLETGGGARGGVTLAVAAMLVVALGAG